MEKKKTQRLMRTFKRFKKGMNCLKCQNSLIKRRKIPINPRMKSTFPIKLISQLNTIDFIGETNFSISLSTIFQIPQIIIIFRKNMLTILIYLQIMDPKLPLLEFPTQFSNIFPHFHYHRRKRKTKEMSPQESQEAIATLIRDRIQFFSVTLKQTAKISQKKCQNFISDHINEIANKIQTNGQSIVFEEVLKEWMNLLNYNIDFLQNSEIKLSYDMENMRNFISDNQIRQCPTSRYGINASKRVNQFQKKNKKLSIYHSEDALEKLCECFQRSQKRTHIFQQIRNTLAE